MLAVKAYFDGNGFVPFEKKSFEINQNALIVVEEKSSQKKSCRGIAAKYANSALIEKEAETAKEAFSGTL